MPRWHKIQLGLGGALLLTSGLAGGMVLEREVVNRQEESGPTGRFADVEAAVDVVQDNYYYLPTDATERQTTVESMREGAVGGALESLGDPYTRYIPADDSATANENLDGTYGGIGVDILVQDDLAFISFVVPESPAEQAGLRRGDVLESIDGTQLSGMSAEDIVRLLRGEVGQQRQISAYRPDTGDVLTLSITMEEIIVPQVIFAMIPNTTIGHVKITQFGGQTIPGIDKAIATLQSNGATAVILDLRSNTGGLVDVAQRTLGRFIDDPDAVAFIEDDDPAEGGETEMPVIAPDNGVVLDLPMVVLVDHSTASAAEIVAGALKDYDRATVIGETTYGKGSVQRIFRFSDGATMRVTVAEWFTPSRARIQGTGIVPDVEITASGTTTSEDPVITAAVQYLTRTKSSPVPSASPDASPAP